MLYTTKINCNYFLSSPPIKHEVFSRGFDALLVIKSRKYLEKPAAKSCRFLLVPNAFSYHVV